MGRNGQSGATDELDPLISMAIKGDTLALEQLFEPCLPQLRRTAGRILNNPDDSEDALQDGLVSALRHLGKFEGRAKFSTWMQTIVANAAKSILRKRRRGPMTLSFDEPHPEYEYLCLADLLPDPSARTEEQYDRLERSRILDVLLQGISPAFQSIIWLCDVKGLSLKEAAGRLGLSVIAAKTRHFRAKKLILNAAKEAFPNGLSGIGSCQFTGQPLGPPRVPEGNGSSRRFRSPARKRDVAGALPPKSASLMTDSKSQRSEAMTMVL